MDIVFNFTVDKSPYPKTFFAKIIKTALAVLSLSKETVGLSINLVGERRMRFLNKEHRGKDRSTDVLSFPLLSRSALEKKWHRSLRAKKAGSGIIELGDVFICWPVVRQRAELENKNPEAHLRLLVAHSFLHLLGFDHEGSVRDAEEMSQWQDKILERLN